MRLFLQRYKPGVPNSWLLLIAGSVWTFAGLMLCIRAFALLGYDSSFGAIGGASAVAAVVWNRFMFGKLANRNSGRIAQLPSRACVFAFAPWKGYGMILLMIILGGVLRHSTLPKEYLAAAYFTMGGTLLLSSRVFYESFVARQRSRRHRIDNINEEV